MRWNWLAIIPLVGVICGAGCGKSKSQQNAAPIVRNDVSVDIPKLELALASASPDVRNSVSKAQFAFRYEDYRGMLGELDKLAADPSLTPDQKKLASDVIEQVKQLAAKSPTSPH